GDESPGLRSFVATAPAGPPGDYNGDGIVDAADYTVWRDTLGSTSDQRANGDSSGASAGKIDQADYLIWKNNSGNHAGSGAIGCESVSVPEPPSARLVVTGIVLSMFLAPAGMFLRSIFGVRKVFPW